MKIKRLVVKNVLSYQARTEFTFDYGMNIIIGPNGAARRTCSESSPWF